MQEQLVKHIDAAYAMEQNVLRMLDGTIETSDDPEMRSALETHKRETEGQGESVSRPPRCARRGPVHDQGGRWHPRRDDEGRRHMARADKAGRNARDGYATEHMEIASYQLLERVAVRVGDEETAAVARQNRAEEEAMAKMDRPELGQGGRSLIGAGGHADLGPGLSVGHWVRPLDPVTDVTTVVGEALISALLGRADSGSTSPSTWRALV